MIDRCYGRRASQNRRVAADRQTDSGFGDFIVRLKKACLPLASSVSMPISEATSAIAIVQLRTTWTDRGRRGTVGRFVAY